MLKQINRIIMEEHWISSLDDLRDSPVRLCIIFILVSYIIHMSNFYIGVMVSCALLWLIYYIEDKITDRHVGLIKEGIYPLIVTSELLDKSLTLIINYDNMLKIIRHDPDQLKDHDIKDIKEKLLLARESYLSAYRLIWMCNQFDGRYVPKCTSNRELFGELVNQINQK